MSTALFLAAENEAYFSMRPRKLLPQKQADKIRGHNPALKKSTFEPIISSNNTRQGYALRSTLKPAGYFFPGSA